jgi:hypothetical protein
MRMNCACGPTSDIEVTSVEPLGGYRLRFVFSDGSSGEKDFTDLVRFDSPMTAELADTALFARISIKNGTPVWPNGLDLAPWTLHESMKRAGALSAPSTHTH